MKNIIILIGLIFAVISISCNKDHKRLKIIDFSENIEITLIPYNYKTYVSFVVKVEGYTNDTIKITRKGYYDINLSGKIDTLISGDYYGTEKVTYTFSIRSKNNGNQVFCFIKSASVTLFWS